MTRPYPVDRLPSPVAPWSVRRADPLADPGLTSGHAAVVDPQDQDGGVVLAPAGPALLDGGPDGVGRLVRPQRRRAPHGLLQLVERDGPVARGVGDTVGVEDDDVTGFQLIHGALHARLDQSEHGALHSERLHRAVGAAAQRAGMAA